MSTTNHTDIAVGAAGDSGIVNAPLGQLDAAIGNRTTLTTTNQSGYKSGTAMPKITSAVTTIDTRLLGVTLTATWTDATGTRTLTLYQEFGK